MKKIIALLSAMILAAGSLSVVSAREDENKVYDYETNEELGYIRDPDRKSDDCTAGIQVYYDEKSGGFVGQYIGDRSDILSKLRGDINLDGIVDVTDLSKFSLMFVEEVEFTPSMKLSADIDGDDEVTLSDLARMRQYVSKRIDIF